MIPAGPGGSTTPLGALINLNSSIGGNVENRSVF